VVAGRVQARDRSIMPRLKADDRLRYRLGLPNLYDVVEPYRPWIPGGVVPVARPAPGRRRGPLDGTDRGS
jgi:hypothetical protein